MAKGIIFSFIAGAGVGSLVTWKILREEYERRTQEEIDSVKDVFRRRHGEPTEESKETDEKPIDISEAKAKAEAAREKPSITEYTAKLQEQGYTNYSDISKNNTKVEENVKKEEEEEMDEPYVISPDEFGEAQGYELISLTYYADDVLTDDNDEIVEDVDDVVGSDFADHFGEYEDDSVFVRNDRLRADYEILKDRRRYSDVKSKMTRNTED